MTWGGERGGLSCRVALRQELTPRLFYQILGVAARAGGPCLADMLTLTLREKIKFLFAGFARINLAVVQIVPLRSGDDRERERVEGATTWLKIVTKQVVRAYRSPFFHSRSKYDSLPKSPGTSVL